MPAWREAEAVAEAPAPRAEAPVLRTGAPAPEPSPPPTARKPSSPQSPRTRRVAGATPASDPEPVPHDQVAGHEVRRVTATSAPTVPLAPPLLPSQATSPVRESDSAQTPPAPVPAAPRTTVAPEPRTAMLPPAALKALERLSRMSIAAAAQPAPSRPPHSAAVPVTAPAPPKRNPAESPVVVATQTGRREEPARPAALHIASIQVTVISPPPAPPPPAPTPPRPSVMPAPTGRLSRLATGFGFGQA